MVDKKVNLKDIGKIHWDRSQQVFFVLVDASPTDKRGQWLKLAKARDGSTTQAFRWVFQTYMDMARQGAMQSTYMGQEFFSWYTRLFSI